MPFDELHDRLQDHWQPHYEAALPWGASLFVQIQQNTDAVGPAATARWSCRVHNQEKLQKRSQLSTGDDVVSAPHVVTLLRSLLHMVCLQLQNSKDVVAQAQAVAGLAAQLGAGSFTGRSREQGRVDDYIITILSQVMRDDSYFCRCALHHKPDILYVWRCTSYQAWLCRLCTQHGGLTCKCLCSKHSCVKTMMVCLGCFVLGFCSQAVVHQTVAMG
jgi:hypothetical protein